MLVTATFVYGEKEALVESAAKRALLALEQVSTSHSCLAISGGSALTVAKRLLTLWREKNAGQGTGARTLCITFADERLVPTDDPQSNFGAAKVSGMFEFWSGIEVLPMVRDELALELECQADAFRRAFSLEPWNNEIDVAILGMGADGHTASLFPGVDVPTKSALASTPTITTAMTTTVTTVTNSPKPPKARLSLTLEVLKTAKANVVFATGEKKRSALSRVKAGDLELPISHLPNVTVFTDVRELVSSP